MTDIIKLAMENGFEHYGPARMDAVVPREDVREMCKVNRCGKYGASWSCPPGCGSLEKCVKELKSYEHGVLVQSTIQLKSEFDYRGIQKLEEIHKKRFLNYARQVRILIPDCLPLNAGTCTVCRKCTYPNKPCRFPNKRIPSMEAYGLWVGDICVKSGLQYNYGERTMTFTSCVLYNKE